MLLYKFKSTWNPAEKADNIEILNPQPQTSDNKTSIDIGIPGGVSWEVDTGGSIDIETNFSPSKNTVTWDVVNASFLWQDFYVMKDFGFTKGVEIESRSLKEYDQSKELRYARTCYDHIAGEVGVGLTDRRLELGMIERSGRDFVVSKHGYDHFKHFGINVDNVQKGRRHFARQCLDWSEGFLVGAVVDVISVRKSD